MSMYTTLLFSKNSPWYYAAVCIDVFVNFRNALVFQSSQLPHVYNIPPKIIMRGGRGAGFADLVAIIKFYEKMNLPAP